ncbi:uncharacterized protein BXZ73DRAFT_105392 [Epithele typhae]|uniref:uncharacterized protein n=1 Tax=Epithele typhae TaxID=378194 RepID=UPI0020080965|nr:uncharacterized protein BXZ73DRAFT_105392 [Epithele typhae]KAH9917870.1 hypothetical protein BXZ73DRAFT_105392 [Epithele typhae]
MVLPLKTLFLLFLTLPHTSGFVWLCTTHLCPFFAAHEHKINTALTQPKAYLYSYAQRPLRRGWNSLSAAVTHKRHLLPHPRSKKRAVARQRPGPRNPSYYGPAILAGTRWFS